jgi:large-conductance mechanosensitive channel
MKTIMHHILESNWINFVIAGVIMFLGYQYVENLRTENKNLQLQLEVNRESEAIVYNDIYTRLMNIEETRKVESEVWGGVRTIRYK